MRRSFYVAGALALSAGVLPAQASTRSRSRSDDSPARTYTYSSDRFDDRDRAAIGITTSSGGMRDTLGLLVSSVTAGGPADKAGIEEGNRLVSINGVNLRLSAADAGEGDMGDIANRRLIRELEKVKAGDDVELRVWAGGQAKTVKVKTIALEDLPSRTRNVRREIEDRPVLGLSLSATGSRRDTLGMLVVRVSTDGPAEKAGLVEGDRISAINGVSLRVAPEDAGDGYMSSARMNRYRRELSKVSVGEDVELRVLSGGQSKTIRIKPVRAGDLPRQRGGVMIIGDGAVDFGDMFPAFPSITIPPAAPMSPRTPRVFEFDGNLNDGFRMRIDPRARMEIEQQAEDAVRRAREAARDAFERIERFRFDPDRRADDIESTAPAVAPVPPPSTARARASSRIAAASTAPSYGYAYGTSGDATYGTVSYAPEPTPIAPAVSTTIEEPASLTGSVAVWSGDDAAFTLQGLRLARVNDDLAENLGRGSEQGFLVLDVGRRWFGLRAGDVLLEVDGRAVRDGRSARIALGSTETHTASVIRDGRSRVVSIDVR
jgi:S1-C subfamily serine protease